MTFFSSVMSCYVVRTLLPVPRVSARNAEAEKLIVFLHEFNTRDELVVKKKGEEWPDETFSCKTKRVRFYRQTTVQLRNHLKRG